MAIPPEVRELLTRPNFAFLATIMPDGSPQVTPVWCDVDGEGHVLVNTARGRRKERNVRRDPRVALAVADAANPYRYAQIRGRVIELTETGADAHIDRLAQKYLNVEIYPYRRPGEVRVILRIRPERIQTVG
ncbi:MAG TPA: PPOX class F420-dependent oxidoreductase [Vicinamibacterales bacterium]|nr:PPOX class F420-dependent oxidoreductase [Vicinamibacterales bacterium]